VEIGGIAADLGIGEIETAAEIAAIGALDLDHPRAQILQAQRGIGAGEKLAQVDDDEARERQLGRRGHQAFSVFPTQSAGCLYFTVCRCSQ